MFITLKSQKGLALIIIILIVIGIAVVTGGIYWWQKSVIKKDITSEPKTKLSQTTLTSDDLSLIQSLSENNNNFIREAAVNNILDMGSKIIPLLVQGLKSSDKSINIECTRLLGEIKAKEAVPELIQYLQNTEDTQTILVTSYALGEIQDIRATSELLSMALPVMNDTTRRRATITALGLLGDTSVVPSLIEILSDDNELLRVFAAGSLGMLGSDKGFDIAFEATESKEFSTRSHAIQALGLIGDRDALSKLDKILMSNPKFTERSTINLAIFQIHLKGLSSNQKKIDAIKNQLLTVAEIESSTRMWFFNELVRIGSSDAKKALNEVIAKPNLHEEATRKLKILKIIEASQ